MLNGLKMIFERFGRLVDWFIPPELATNRDMRKQVRMFLVSHICGPFLGNTVPAALYVFAPSLGYKNAVLAASITGFWIFPFLLKYTKQYNILAILSIENLMFCIIWSCLILDGITSPTLPWVLTIPLLSFFYLGSAPEIRILVLVMFAANFTAFWILSQTTLFEPSSMSPIAAQGLGIVSTVAASMYVAMMALFYAKALASQSELVVEMRSHMATALELREAVAAAERADIAKSELLATLSHELRNPLNTVIGYSELLLDDYADGDREGQTELLRIRNSGMDLLRLVNDVLDLAKIESGRMEIFSESFRPADLLESLVAEVMPAAVANASRLNLEIDGELGVISSDMRKVRIIVIQLLSNAIKFTVGGSILVRARRERSSVQTGMLVFSVEDSGIGIEASKLPTLFERFALNDDVSASKYGGSGLGLALSRKLCLLLGGDIAVETELGRGSRFTVRIPTEVNGGDLAGVFGTVAVLPAAEAPPPTMPAPRWNPEAAMRHVA